MLYYMNFRPGKYGGISLNSRQSVTVTPRCGDVLQVKIPRLRIFPDGRDVLVNASPLALSASVPNAAQMPYLGVWGLSDQLRGEKYRTRGG